MSIDQYTKGYYNYRAHALCRAVGGHSNKAFTKYSLIEVDSTINLLIANDKESVMEIAKSEIMLSYSNFMINELQNNLRLRRMIGGSKWTIEIIDFVVKVYKKEIVTINGDMYYYDITK